MLRLVAPGLVDHRPHRVVAVDQPLDEPDGRAVALGIGEGGGDVGAVDVDPQVGDARPPGQGHLDEGVAAGHLVGPARQHGDGEPVRRRLRRRRRCARWRPGTVPAATEAITAPRRPPSCRVACGVPPADGPDLASPAVPRMHPPRRDPPLRAAARDASGDLGHTQRGWSDRTSRGHRGRAGGPLGVRAHSPSCSVRAARSATGSQVAAPRGPRVATSRRSWRRARLAPRPSRTATLPSRSRPTTRPSRQRAPGRSRQRTRSPTTRPRSASPSGAPGVVHRRVGAHGHETAGPAGGGAARQRGVEPAHPREPAVAVGGPALLERRHLGVGQDQEPLLAQAVDRGVGHRARRQDALHRGGARRRVQVAGHARTPRRRRPACRAWRSPPPSGTGTTPRCPGRRTSSTATRPAPPRRAWSPSRARRPAGSAARPPRPCTAGSRGPARASAARPRGRRTGGRARSPARRGPTSRRSPRCRRTRGCRRSRRTGRSARSRPRCGRPRPRCRPRR